MLIRFRVGNFSSFREPVEFSMVPTREKAHRDLHLYKSHSVKERDLLRAAVIYGANASGKSNFIKAFSFAERFITKGVRPQRAIGANAFKLDQDCKDRPSSFYFEIQMENKMFSYEFSITNEAVISESLSELTKTKTKLLFTRSFDSDENRFEFGGFLGKLSKEDKQKLVFVSEGTRKNQLFVTESIERNLDFFKPVYDWFSKCIRVFTPQSIGHGVEFRLGNDEEFKEFLTEVLSEFDPSVVGIESQLVGAEAALDFPPRLFEDLNDELDNGVAVFVADVVKGNRSVVLKKDGELKLLKIFTQHESIDNGEKVTFDLEEESDGTRRLIELAPLFFELLRSEEVVIAFIDELDRSLHPLLTRRLLDIFLRHRKGHMAQIVISTHNSVLLDVDLLRRDEIWFIDKGDGSSKLKSLQRDFNPRYDKDIRKDYLYGSYGGIPRIRNS
ncbi:AAA family ATPase [uncultured Pseudoteredinibacter sp.]|uniref:AAA family ATPase n=1 Tax=uncultured Pseudoteredinibacter sp. TaxID=1641701 RepID=UPI00261D4C43|nr:AAA family ATPase [uncultured Pseudoteredinibacter sp.]